MCRPFVQYVINDNFNKILDYIVYFRKSVSQLFVSENCRVNVNGECGRD